MATLAAVPKYEPTAEDRILENKLETLLAACTYNTDISKRRKLWRDYTQLHATRSPGMVLHLERLMGLAH